MSGAGGDLRVGLVGCGRIAELGYRPALERARGLRLAAVADPDPERREHLRGEGCAYPGAAELLAEGGIDALVIATPVDAHLPDARIAAEHGMPTLVEKPPAADSAGAKALAALEPVPWIGFNRRFEDHQELREAAGDSDGVDLELGLRYRRRSWGAHTVADEALLDLGPHLVDLARWISGDEPREACTRALTRDRAEFVLRLGERGRARLTCATDRAHREHAAVRDLRGRRLARRRVGGLVPGLAARVVRRGGEHPLVDALTRQLEAFGRVVRGGGDPDLATAADGYAAMTALDAVRRSAAAGGEPVTVEAAG